MKSVSVGLLKKWSFGGLFAEEAETDPDLLGKSVGFARRFAPFW